MERIKQTPIQEKKEFTFDGSTLKFVEYNPETNTYLYSRWFGKNSPGYGRQMGWEVVKPVKRKQPDGTIVECYPNSEQFGTHGLFFPPRTTIECLRKALAKTSKEEMLKTIHCQTINTKDDRLYLK